MGSQITTLWNICRIILIGTDSPVLIMTTGLYPLLCEQIPIEERIEQLMNRLSETEACGFEELFSDVQTRAGMIVTFLALLEMIRMKRIRVFQQGSFAPIRVYRRAASAAAPFGAPDAPA